MEIFVSCLLFAAGILFIVKGGDWFVDAAAWIAEVSGIPKVIVGATVVSLATTLPEIIVSLLAAFQGKPDMAIGNAVGSVTANIGLILAISAICMPMVIKRSDFAPKAGLMLAGVVALLIFSRGGSVSPVGSIVLFSIFILFIFENLRSAKKNISNDRPPKPTAAVVRSNIIKFILGTAGIVVGAQLLVDNGSILAKAIGVPEAVISVTIIAIGTSLPELVTTLTSIIKKQGSLSVGNIIGANIIDTTLILPLCGLASGKALPFSAQGLTLDMPACLLVSAIAIIPMIVKGKLMRWQGFVLMATYIGYVVMVCV